MDPALMVVDVQRDFDDAGYWGARNDPAYFKPVVTGEPDVLMTEQATATNLHAEFATVVSTRDVTSPVSSRLR